MSTQMREEGFFFTAFTRVTMSRLAQKTEGDITPSRRKVFEWVRPRCIVTRPPSEEPASPVLAASVRVRNVLSMSGLSSSTRKRP